MNMCPGTQRNIFMPQASHFRQSQTGLNSGKQESVIATSQPSFLIRRRQQRIDFRPGQEVHHGARLSLARNRKHALDEACVRRRL